MNGYQQARSQKLYIRTICAAAFSRGLSGASAGREGSYGAREVVRFTFLQLLVHLPVVLFPLWALAYTLPYHPPWGRNAPGSHFPRAIARRSLPG
jgi:hypothetical protein